MNSFTINMRSSTQAQKARAYLAKMGIRGTVERVSGKGGCRFSLRVNGNRGEVCALLSSIGIPCDIS